MMNTKYSLDNSFLTFNMSGSGNKSDLQETSPQMIFNSLVMKNNSKYSMDNSFLKETSRMLTNEDILPTSLQSRILMGLFGSALMVFHHYNHKYIRNAIQ